jgi:hypothetical protein
MKKLLLSVFAIALTVSAVQAQSTQGRGHHGQSREAHSNKGKAYGKQAGQCGNKGQYASYNRFYEQLNLTDAQKGKADQLQSQLRNGLQALRSDNSLSQDQKRSQMMALVQRNQQDFRSILTYEQGQQYDQMMRDMQNRTQSRQKGNKNTNTNTSYGTYGNSSQSFSSNPSSSYTLANILGGATSTGTVGNVAGNNFSISDILGSLNLETILGILGSVFGG